MPIRKLSKSKRLSKTKRVSKSKKSIKTTKLSKSKRLSKSYKKLKHKLKSRKHKTIKHRGGFFGSSNCSIASVKEPGFNLPSYGVGASQISGFSIPDQKAIIFDPKCPSAPSQAGV